MEWRIGGCLVFLVHVPGNRDILLGLTYLSLVEWRKEKSVRIGRWQPTSIDKQETDNAPCDLLLGPLTFDGRQASNRC